MENDEKKYEKLKEEPITLASEKPSVMKLLLQFRNFFTSNKILFKSIHNHVI